MEIGERAQATPLQPHQLTHRLLHRHPWRDFSYFNLKSQIFNLQSQISNLHSSIFSVGSSTTCRMKSPVCFSLTYSS